jgi:hypothetical protein
MRRLFGELLFRLFIWSGSKLFDFVAIYPNNENDDVQVIHFADSNKALMKAAHDLIDHEYD